MYILSQITLLLCIVPLVTAWIVPSSSTLPTKAQQRAHSSALFMAEEKIAKHVTGEELELMLTEWDQPLVVDAYATW